MIKTRYPYVFLILLLVCVGGLSSVINAQQERKEFSIRIKERYFLGENPAVAIVITNTGRSPKTVKEAEHQKFKLELFGDFSDSVSNKREVDYDGSVYYPPARQIGGILEWYMPIRRDPMYVTLQPGESTAVHFDLQSRFDKRLEPGKYRLGVKSDRGRKVVKDFEIYFDNEKSVPILVKALEIGYDHGDRSWAISFLAEFNRPKLISVLEELIKSGDEGQRKNSALTLWEIREGNIDSLQLRVKGNERYSPNESPSITISIQSNLETPQTVVEPQQQRFSLELRQTSPNESKEETRTCTYAPKDPLQKTKLATLPSYDDLTSFTLNLQECFGERLEAGNYELSVKGLDQKELKYQIAVQKFQIVALND